jgi:E3 ubiquitin-protein ligase SIAH1
MAELGATTDACPDLIKLHDDDPEGDAVAVADGLSEDILSALECPVCMEYMAPPIFLCQNGHNVCEQCRPQLPACPACRQPFLASTRNLALESIARGIQFPCRNEGCVERCRLGAIAQHEAECAHRPFECPLTQGAHCTWKGPLALVKKHVMDAHRRYVRIGEESTSVLHGVSNTAGYSLVIFAFEQVFLQKSRLQDSRFFSALQYIGPRQNAAKFRFEFELSTRRDHQKVIVGNLVHSQSHDFTSVTKNADCVRLDYDVIKRFMYEDKLPYKLRLYRIEEEVSL